MGAESRGYHVVAVSPFGVVIHFFRHQRHATHEPERLIEVGKDESFGDSLDVVVVVDDHAPAAAMKKWKKEFLSLV